VREMIEFRKRYKLKGVSPRSLIDAGRKH
jgi:hypothetical protein